jgi:ribosomal peptide maturation radical SAM protein 1
MVFSKYVFPEYWEKNQEKIREYFNNKILKYYDNPQKFSFDKYIELTDIFYEYVIKNVEWRSYDIIGFTLNYGQLLPSLAIAKKIKELDPNKSIIFGGSRTVDDLGKRILGEFEYVDFIVSGDGEDALFNLASDFLNYKTIPRVMYRNGKEICWNKSNENVDLNGLTIPDYDPFFEELNNTTEEIQQYFSLYGKLPIEISRGCWWNKCSFCNLNVQHHIYREKNVDKIIEEIEFLSDKYKILSYQLIGNTLPKNNYKMLLKKIIDLDKDFTFFVEARAGQLESEDYTILKDAGFIHIQTGIETFSQNYIRKMNKGTRVIDNIASLKFCKENEIINNYNIIINYPNEEKIDFEETKKNIQLFKQFLDPPQISYLIVGFGSLIYNNPEMFNIEKFDFTEIDKIMFPEEILKKGISFFYRFKRRQNLDSNPWEQLVEEWKRDHEKNLLNGIKTKITIDKLIFYFIDGGDFLRIYDKRDSDNIQIYILDELERAVFLACLDVISYNELCEMFSDLPDFKLASILHTFEKYGIVYKEDNHYLSLPLRYSKDTMRTNKKKSLQLVYSSGINRSL